MSGSTNPTLISLTKQQCGSLIRKHQEGDSGKSKDYVEGFSFKIFPFLPAVIIRNYFVEF